MATGRDGNGNGKERRFGSKINGNGNKMKEGWGMNGKGNGNGKQNDASTETFLLRSQQRATGQLVGNKT